MSLFSQTILSWREPAAYAYRKSPSPWIGLSFPIIVIIASTQIQGIPWLDILIMVFIFTLIGILPLIRRHWPSAIPLTGFPVALYEDEIVRVAYKASIRIALDNIAECHVSTQIDKDGSYSILSFTPKEKVFGVLTETAISDSTVTEQLIAYLRSKEVTVSKIN